MWIIWWVVGFICGGDGWLKERDIEKNINRERERERERLDYIILLGSIFYFNELYDKIETEIMTIL